MRKGDTVGVIAPSWCGPAVFPHRLERGIGFLESAGYEVVLAQNARGRRGHLSGTAEERVADIHQMFADPRVKAIISAIGGNHSCHLLPLLDWDLIRHNPKVFMGFSDATVLNLAVHAKTGLVTFNGPSVMNDLAEFPAPLPYTARNMWKVIGEVAPAGTLLPAAEWTEEFLDWGTKDDLTRPRALQPSPGWTWLKTGADSASAGGGVVGASARGAVQGPLIGGCLESMEHLRGTPYWPEMAGAILLFETSEETPSPAWVDAVLQDYENMGVFAKIAGLLVGRPMGYSEEQKGQLRQVLLDRTKGYAFPVVADMDFGHTSPQLTLPIGCLAEVNSETRQISLLEAAVR